MSLKAKKQLNSNQKKITKTKKKKTKKSNYWEESKEEFNVSADIFIHLKKGDINDYYTINETLGEGAFG